MNHPQRRLIIVATQRAAAIPPARSGRILRLFHAPARSLRGLLLALFALSFPVSAFAQIDEAQFQNDLKAIAAPSNRIIGTDGYAQTARYLREQIRSLPGAELKEQTFPVMVPVTISAKLALPGAAGGAPQTVDVYPFWPAGVRLNATPPGGIKGALVYVNEADFEDMKPAALKGNIAIVEASSAGQWNQAAYFGARAIVILGTPETNNYHLRSHDLLVPVNVPRYYVPASPLADSLRKPPPGDATITAKINWVRRTATNLYAFVKPRTPVPAGWQEGQPNPGALMISVPYDSSGFVPDLAKGASQAVQTASGLALLRDLSKHPLDRPVLLFFSGADSIQFLGSRNMFLALAEAPTAAQTEIDKYLKWDSDARKQLARLREIQPDPRAIDPKAEIDGVVVARLTKLIETDFTQDQDKLFRFRKRGADQVDKNELARLEDAQLVLSQLRYLLRERPKELAGIYLEKAIYYIQQAIRQLGDGSGPGLIRDFEDRANQLQQRIDLYGWLADSLQLPKADPASVIKSRLIEMEVALDFSSNGRRVGPMFFGQYQKSANIHQIQDYKDWLTKQADAKRRFASAQDRWSRDQSADAAAELKQAQGDAEAARWWDEIRGVVDLDPLGGSRSAASWLGSAMPIGSEMAQAWGVPGITLMTLDDLRLRRDTPTDTLAHVDTNNILRQLRAVRTLLWHAWNDPRFKGQRELRQERVGFEGQVVAEAAGRPVPDLPLPNYLATYYHVSGAAPIPPLGGIGWTLGVRRCEIADCDTEGRYRFEGLPQLGPDPIMRVVAAEVYRVEQNTGVITGVTDLGKNGPLTGNLYVDLHPTAITPIRNEVFECVEFSLIGLYDPQFLQTLAALIPLDARRNSAPQRYNFLLSNQMCAGYAEPDSKLFLLFRYGTIGNRLVLLDMKDPASAKPGTQGDSAIDAANGFEVDRLRIDAPPERAIGPLASVTAQDFWRLNEIRLNDYRKVGVASPLIDSMHSDAKAQIDAAKTAEQGGTAANLIERATAAWANEARVYAAAADMANDVVRGAIFLLLLCVPFSFCMERLVVASPNIYKQLTWMGVIFALMTLALWAFHPAFRISSNPLIIILAFAIIFMSIVVISVVYSKFDTELKRIRSGRGEVEGASFARASVLMSAVQLGIANMRKRKFRTLLTAITIVLITFAVLCFTSSTRYLSTTRLPTSVQTRFPGLLLRQRGFRNVPAAAINNLKTVLAKHPSPDGKPWQIAEQWWCVNPNDPNEQTNVVAYGPDRRAKQDWSAASWESRPRVFSASAVLGLSPGYSQLKSGPGDAPIVEVIGKKAFDRLENGEQNIIYFSRPIAEQLGVREGDTVQVGGLDLEVAAIFDSDEYEQKVTTIAGEPLSPLNYRTGSLDSGGRELKDEQVESLDLDAQSSASELSSAYEHLPPTQFVIVPAGTAKLLTNASLRGLTLRARDEKQVADLSDELSKRFAIAIFAGFNDGVKLVAAGNSLPQVSGAQQVAIPLTIAGLIIFNTMMGSIAERRREIHVYTSLGLAPLHVGALFVAEALTYGLLGTVFGYVIGQLVGTLLTHFHLLGNVTLNYSGTSAILTMGLILLIVLLSALVPARLASKIAAPSIERNWKVPLPKDDHIIAPLPFTINKTAADGALAYLADYFDAHQEGSIGTFSAGRVEAFTFEDGALAGASLPPGVPDKSRGLKTVIWLTPFDLGVRQHFMLLIHPGQYPDIYEVQVVLQRLSGGDKDWYRMNRAFLTSLRKQFLQWRSLSPQKMLQYVEESRKLFRSAPPAPIVTTAATEDVRLA